MNLCRWPDREAVGTDATRVERRGPALGKGVDPGLPRLTVLCREPPVAVESAHLCADGPRSAQDQRRSFFIFGLSFFFAKGTLVRAFALTNVPLAKKKTQPKKRPSLPRARWGPWQRILCRAWAVGTEVCAADGHRRLSAKDSQPG
jgi:hypothetical protein